MLHLPGCLLADGAVSFGCWLSCVALLQVVHDFEHGGLTNDFLVNSLDVLAVRYNDRSPLENHHLAAAFTLMRQPDYDFVCNVPKAEFDKLRKVGWGWGSWLLVGRVRLGSCCWQDGGRACLGVGTCLQWSGCTGVVSARRVQAMRLLLG